MHHTGESRSSCCSGSSLANLRQSQKVGCCAGYCLSPGAVGSRTTTGLGASLIQPPRNAGTPASDLPTTAGTCATLVRPCRSTKQVLPPFGRAGDFKLRLGDFFTKFNACNRPDCLFRRLPGFVVTGRWHPVRPSSTTAASAPVQNRSSSFRRNCTWRWRPNRSSFYGAATRNVWKWRAGRWQDLSGPGHRI